MPKTLFESSPPLRQAQPHAHLAPMALAAFCLLSALAPAAHADFQVISAHTPKGQPPLCVHGCVQNELPPVQHRAASAHLHVAFPGMTAVPDGVREYEERGIRVRIERFVAADSRQSMAAIKSAVLSAPDAVRQGQEVSAQGGAPNSAQSNAKNSAKPGGHAKTGMRWQAPQIVRFAAGQYGLGAPGAHNLTLLRQTVRDIRQRYQQVWNVEVTGYASPEGPQALNLELSGKRAQAVANWLRRELRLHYGEMDVQARAGGAASVSPGTAQTLSITEAASLRNVRITVTGRPHTEKLAARPDVQPLARAPLQESIRMPERVHVPAQKPAPLPAYAPAPGYAPNAVSGGGLVILNARTQKAQIETETPSPAVENAQSRLPDESDFANEEALP